MHAHLYKRRTTDRLRGAPLSSTVVDAQATMSMKHASTCQTLRGRSQNSLVGSPPLSQQRALKSPYTYNGARPPLAAVLDTRDR